MIYPQINLNGTSAEELIEQQLAVHKAAGDLLSALRQALPHGRDYQTLPHGGALVHLEARQQAEARYHAVAKIADEAMDIALNIQAQQIERENRSAS
jgi:hypothetical protein